MQNAIPMHKDQHSSVTIWRKCIPAKRFFAASSRHAGWIQRCTHKANTTTATLVYGDALAKKGLCDVSEDIDAARQSSLCVQKCLFIQSTICVMPLDYFVLNYVCIWIVWILNCWFSSQWFEFRISSGIKNFKEILYKLWKRSLAERFQGRWDVF